MSQFKFLQDDEIKYPEPTEILNELSALETEIQQGINELRGMLDR